MTLMKIELDKLSKQLGDEGINELYMYNCLKLSGFNKKKSYELIGLLNDLWLKDETDTTIGRLSDMLYDIYEDIKDNIDNMTTREILVKMFMGV